MEGENWQFKIQFSSIQSLLLCVIQQKKVGLVWKGEKKFAIHTQTGKGGKQEQGLMPSSLAEKGLLHIIYGICQRKEKCIFAEE